MNSYRHSYPTEGVPLVIINYEDNEDVLPERARRSWGWKKLGIAVMLLGVLVVSALAAMSAPSEPEAAALLGSPLPLEGKSHKSSATTIPGDEGGPPNPEDAPKPDLDKGAGGYDWQKCKDSDDPDCWKNEGERVHSYWHDFGQKMKSFWSNFGERMRSFWSKKE
mmetsp:Transcript_21311/g.43776  ORF Transcript_21311/g.43776 Transcript_21311/m.43776 type:complete len:165 (-) Transcript_21311:2166-2660(-)